MNTSGITATKWTQKSHLYYYTFCAQNLWAILKPFTSHSAFKSLGLFHKNINFSTICKLYLNVNASAFQFITLVANAFISFMLFLSSSVAWISTSKATILTKQVVSYSPYYWTISENLKDPCASDSCTCLPHNNINHQAKFLNVKINRIQHCSLF